MLNRSREISVEMGPTGPIEKIGKIQLSDIFEYADRFPEDVDNLRQFVKAVQAIDEEFIEYGTRKSKTSS